MEVVRILREADYAARIAEAAELLRAGSLVVLPTETVYGAMALIGHPAARERLRVLRGEDAARPVVPHLSSAQEAEWFIGELTPTAKRMMGKLWPGPVGLQFDVERARRAGVAAELKITEGEVYDGSLITLRCPDHRVFADVAAAAGGALAAVKVGGIGEFDADRLATELAGKVELILDAGQPRFSKPSTLVKLDTDGYRVVRAGVYDERTIRRLMKTTILFICSGNTCRSPMAEAITRGLLAERLGVGPADLEAKGFEVLSAGSHAVAGARATPAAVDAVKLLGGDLSRHRSRPLTVELINQADYIYTMGKNHSRAVTAMTPAAEKKVQTLNGEKDIDDPIGGDAKLYNELARQLRALIETRLKERALP
jgi:protein-tyrosine phosphatase